MSSLNTLTSNKPDTTKYLEAEKFNSTVISNKLTSTKNMGSHCISLKTDATYLMTEPSYKNAKLTVTADKK